MKIRKARIQDLERILEIYNYEVLYGISTLDLTVKTLEERKEWFDQHNIENHPLYVAEVDGIVAGYVCLSSYREKEAYCSTVELSVYVDVAYRRKGIASMLMEFILEEARKREDIHSIISVITSVNDASRHLHKKFGFQYSGTIREAGMKHGSYQDIENYQLMV